MALGFHVERFLHCRAAYQYGHVAVQHIHFLLMRAWWPRLCAPYIQPGDYSWCIHVREQMVERYGTAEQLEEYRRQAEFISLINTSSAFFSSS